MPPGHLGHLRFRSFHSLADRFIDCSHHQVGEHLGVLGIHHLGLNFQTLDPVLAVHHRGDGSSSRTGGVLPGIQFFLKPSYILLHFLGLTEHALHVSGAAAQTFG